MQHTPPVRFFGIAPNRNGLDNLLHEICTDPEVPVLIRRILDAGHRIALANFLGTRPVVLIETLQGPNRARAGDTLREALTKALAKIDELQGDRDA